MKEGNGNPTKPGSDEASPEDVLAAVKSLTEADHNRLRGYAVFRLRGCCPAVLKGRQWKDLVSEAIARTLDNSRKWQKTVPFVTFLIKVMRSIASHWDEEARAKPGIPASALRYEDDEGEEVDPLETFASPDPGPEQQAIAREQLGALLEHFADDDLVNKLVAGMAKGYRVSELPSHLGISAKRCSAGIKRLRRQARHLLGHGGKQ